MSPMSTFFRPPTATDHPLSDYLSDYLYIHLLSSLQYSRTLSICSPPYLCLPSWVRPPTPVADCRAIIPFLFSPIPWSLFRFQTPFGWSIGFSSVNESEVVWTVGDSLLEVQLPHIPLIYSSLHWLMEKGVTGQPFIVKEARPENKYIQLFSFCFFLFCSDIVLIKWSTEGKWYHLFW